LAVDGFEIATSYSRMVIYSKKYSRGQKQSSAGRRQQT
jgi:hypothetical protein